MERIGLLSLGLAFCGSGAALAWRVLRRQQTWQVTEGKVTGYEENEEGARFPMVSFSDGSGTAFVFRASVSGVVPETVKVAYDPLYPSQAVVHSFKTNWLFPVLLVGFGVVMLMASTAI